jgi:peptidylprolyl isomerase
VPTSKQARARQQRQMEKVAIAHAERERKKHRQRIVWGVISAVVVVVLVIGAAFAQSKSDDSVSAAPPTTEPTTPTTLRATPASCTALTDKLPEGAPAMPLEAGPAPTKLVKKDITVGTGAEVTKTSKANVDYVGVNCSGKIFDTSFGKKAFDVDMAGGVIEGWLQGLQGMKAGGVRMLSIPSELAYGATGSGELIPPNEPLFFLVRANSVS